MGGADGNGQDERQQNVFHGCLGCACGGDGSSPARVSNLWAGLSQIKPASSMPGSDPTKTFAAKPAAGDISNQPFQRWNPFASAAAMGWLGLC
jgi:hypothetical protein